jgi:phosphatidate cytidylyltransferase
MKELITRSLSGILYVFLIISSALFSENIITTVIFVFSTLALIEFQRLIKLVSPIPVFFLFLLSYVFYIKKRFYLLENILLFNVLIVNTYLVYDLFSKRLKQLKKYQKLILSVIYISGSSYFIIASLRIDEDFGSWITIYLFSLIWINNSFAYLIGKQFGKKLLFKSISPKKTWEGFWGGTLFCILASIVYFKLQSKYELSIFLLIGIMIPIIATIGDLIQSKFKRTAKVKDSGSLIPGHGGFFDRMDSVIFSAPIFYFILKIIKNVS